MLAISFEPEFNAVLVKIDDQAIKEKSSRSATIRSVLYDHYNIVRPDDKVLNRSNAVYRKMQQKVD
jgi:hypothetical protein